MALFSKRQRALVPTTVLGMLAEYGQAVLDARKAGRPVTDPRFDWANFLGPVHMAMFNADKEPIIGELYDAATSATDRDLATLGAYRILAEFSHDLDDPRYLKLYDASLDYMRSLRLSSAHLTGHEIHRWLDTHGDLQSSFDGIFEVAVPSPTEAPPAKPIDPGETRMLALTGPLPEGNAFFAEHMPRAATSSSWKARGAF